MIDATDRSSDPVRDQVWQGRAACRETNPTVFHGIGDDREFPAARRSRERIAKTVCDRCPVRDACLGYALAVPEKYGVWGGTSAQERAALRRRGSGLVDSGVGRTVR